MATEPNMASEEVVSHVGTVDVEGGGGDAGAPTAGIPDSSHSYAGATARRHGSTIFCSLATAVLLVAAVALSAVSLQRSGEALSLAEQNAADAKRLEAEIATKAAEVIVYEPPAPAPPAPPAVVPVPAATPPPATSPPTAPPTTGAPTKPQPTASPSESHPLNPKWFHTDHADYQTVINTDGNEDAHPYLLAGMFCHRQSLQPCGYDEYCPNGKGQAPYHGGPPKTPGWEWRKQEQWSPLPGATPEDGFQWVQVGSVPDVDGGVDGNRCWTWDEFEWGNGEDILTARGEEYMQWILCCEEPDDGTR